MKRFVLVLYVLLAFEAQGALSCPEFIRTFGTEFFSIPGFAEAVGAASPLQAQGLWDRFRDAINDDSLYAPTVEYFDALPAAERLESILTLSDKMLIGNAKYQTQLYVTDRHIPGSGKIVEIGCGRGLTCSSLQFAGPERQFILVDPNKGFMAKAQSRMQKVSAWHGARGIEVKEATILENSVLETSLSPGSIDGVVLNHVLVYSPYFEKELILKMIYEWLPEGGTVVIHEPVDYYQDAVPAAFDNIAEAVRAGSIVLQEADMFARVAFLKDEIKRNDFVFPGPEFSPYHSSPEALVNCSKKVGFKVFRDRATIYRAYYRLILTKPLS